MDGIIGLGSTLALLLLAGGVIGLSDRKHFAPLWLLIAALGGLGTLRASRRA